MGIDVDLKVVLLGRRASGKTSLWRRSTRGMFNPRTPYQTTMQAGFDIKKIIIGEEVVSLGIWDTAGEERFLSITSNYFRGAKAAVVCYDLTDEAFLENVTIWVNEIKKYDICHLYLCGTKYDMLEGNQNARKVDYDYVIDYAGRIQAKNVVETSSLTGQNVEELFHMIAEDYLKDKACSKRRGKL